jgi:hypothetical protein
MIHPYIEDPGSLIRVLDPEDVLTVEQKAAYKILNKINISVSFYQCGSSVQTNRKKNNQKKSLA